MGDTRNIRIPAALSERLDRLVVAVRRQSTGIGQLTTRESLLAAILERGLNEATQDWYGRQAQVPFCSICGDAHHDCPLAPEALGVLEQAGKAAA